MQCGTSVSFLLPEIPKEIPSLLRTCKTMKNKLAKCHVENIALRETVLVTRSVAARFVSFSLQFSICSIRAWNSVGAHIVLHVSGRLVRIPSRSFEDEREFAFVCRLGHPHESPYRCFQCCLRGRETQLPRPMVISVKIP